MHGAQTLSEVGASLGTLVWGRARRPYLLWHRRSAAARADTHTPPVLSRLVSSTCCPLPTSYAAPVQVRNIHIGDTSASQPRTAASSYVAAMLTHGGTISGSDVDDLDLLPPLAGLDSLASLPRGSSLPRNSLPADGSRRNGSISFGISLNPDPSLRHEGSLRHDPSVPDSALNPAYDYALPPSLALIAPEPESSATSEHLYGTTKVTPTTDGAGGGGDSGGLPSDTGEMLAARLPASLLHHGAHTLVHAAVAAGRASRGAVRMTEPAGGVAPLAHASSLDARSDCMSGSTIVMSPFTVSDIHSTHSTHSTQNTDVYVPCGAPTSTPCAIPEDAEVVPADLPPPPPPRAAWPPHSAATEHSTGQHTASTMSTAYPHSSSNLGLSTTDALLVDENIRLLLRQLDCFRERHLFLKRFVMLGREGRRRGGVHPLPWNPTAASQPACMHACGHTPYPVRGGPMRGPRRGSSLWR